MLSFNEFSDYGGLINCSTNNNGWYITYFKPVSAGSKLVIEAFSDKN